jgi:hypothetical protein
MRWVFSMPMTPGPARVAAIHRDLPLPDLHSAQGFRVQGSRSRV